MFFKAHMMGAGQKRSESVPYYGPSAPKFVTQDLPRLKVIRGSGPKYLSPTQTEGKYAK